MSNERSRCWRAGLAALAVLSIGAVTAAAQSCGGEVDRLARQFDLPPDARQAGTTEAPAAPSTPPSGGTGSTTTESRAQSSGVLSPPDTAAPTAIRPPRSAADRPAPPPDAVPPASSAGGKLPTAERQRMAQLLHQAQAAARQGDEQQCLDRLREAQTVPGVPGTK
jgi:hypothetical protein